jgi:hypothetical protein
VQISRKIEEDESVLNHSFASQPISNTAVTIRMPEVQEVPDLETVFAKARAAAMGSNDPSSAVKGQHVVIVTPGRMLMLHPCPPPGSLSSTQVAPIERFLPAQIKRRIAVIAYNEPSAVTASLSTTIPFVDMLLSLAYLGHTVWVFEGHASALAVGCKHADVVLIDDAMVPHLPPNWLTTVRRAMKRPIIYTHDRVTCTLRKATPLSPPVRDVH